MCFYGLKYSTWFTLNQFCETQCSIVNQREKPTRVLGDAALIKWATKNRTAAMLSNFKKIRKQQMFENLYVPFDKSKKIVIDNDFFMAQRAGITKIKDSSGNYTMTIKNGLLEIDFNGLNILRNKDINNLDFVTACDSPDFERVKAEALQLVEKFNVLTNEFMGKVCIDSEFYECLRVQIEEVLDDIEREFGGYKVVLNGDDYYSLHVIEEFAELWAEFKASA